MNKLNCIYDVLKQDHRYVDNEGNILKSNVQTDAMNLDEYLLKLLISNTETKNMFFKNINGTLVFDKISFCWVINNKMFLPDSYTSFKNKIGLIDENRNYISNSNDVVLSFPYKDCVLEFDSTKESEERNEIFFNETLMKKEIDTLLAPKIFSNIKKLDINGEKSISNFDINDNLVIRGNNLIAMYSLLPVYAGKIKLMYWDILYNTSNDQVPYNDSFKHSSWLTMMKNRLEIAKKLLMKNGVIVIECDKNEDAYLKILMDEIFGRDNYINTISLESSTPSGTKLSHKNTTILKTKDSLIIYGNGEPISIKPQYTISDSITNFKYWYEEKNDGFEIRNLREILIKENIISKKEKINDLKISSNPQLEQFLITNSNKIFRKQPSMPKEIKEQSKNNPNMVIKYKDGEGNEHMVLNGDRLAFLSQAVRMIDGQKKITKLLCDIWTDISFHGTQYEGNEDLPNGKKPERLLLRIIDMFTNEKDIVLDAYLGTGTTGAVALKMKRKFIGIEQLNEHYIKSCSRLNYVISGQDKGPVSNLLNWQGGGSFTTFELAKLNEIFIEKINLATDENIDILFEDILSSDFITYKVDLNKINYNVDDFKNLSLNNKKKILVEILDKNMLYINYSDIDDESYNISDKDKKFAKSFYEGK